MAAALRKNNLILDDTALYSRHTNHFHYKPYCIASVDG